MTRILRMIGGFFGVFGRRRAARIAAREDRANLHARIYAIVDGYDHPELAPALERVVKIDRPTRRRRRLFRKAVLLAASLLATAIAAAGGLAYFTTTGHGAATAAAGTVADITLAPGTPSTALYPGGIADVALSITNPNTVKVHIPSLVLDSGIASSQSGCAASVHYTTQNNGGSGWDVSAGGLTLHLSGAISMDTSAASACQNATFKVYLKVGT